MSTSPDADFDLEKLFLPSWAKESPQHNQYAKYEGEPARRDDRGRDRRDRPFRRPDQGGGRPSFPPRPQQRAGGGGGGGAGAGAGAGPRPGGPRPGGPRPGGPRPGGPPRDRDRGPDRDRDRERSAPPIQPLPEVQLAFTPEEHGVDFLAKQIRMTGRAYSLFDIAQLILQKPERHTVTFSVKKKPDGGVVQPLFLCALDDSLWLSEADAVRYVLSRHFTTFYQAERVKIDPPKGVYTFVAQCGLSGVILGPPNYHDYQNQLRKVHAEKFARMPFDAFKARVRIVKDEEVVKKWVEEQSWKTDYICLNLPEPLQLANLEEVEKHFRQVHLATIIKPVETCRMGGEPSRNLRDRELLRLLRQRWEEQKRFPLQLATVLSQQFATRGLQFFKVNKTVTHVSVARPHYLDMAATPVSEGVKRIVDFINHTAKCHHRQLLEALAPRPPAAVIPVPDTASAAAETGAPAPAPTQAPAVPQEPSPALAAVMTDLHWLIHQGHVIEFASGLLETAKKPLPKPVKAAKPQPAPAPVEDGAKVAISADHGAAVGGTEAGIDSSGLAAVEPAPAGETGGMSPVAPADAPAGS